MWGILLLWFLLLNNYGLGANKKPFAVEMETSKKAVIHSFWTIFNILGVTGTSEKKDSRVTGSFHGVYSRMYGSQN